MKLNTLKKFRGRSSYQSNGRVALTYTMEQAIPQIIPLEKLETYSRYFVEELIKETNGKPPFDIALSFYPNRAAYETETGHAFVGPVYAENQGNGFTIHVCEENLRNITSLALQGWMEHETMRCIHDQNGDYSQFNYRKNIFPLMPVTGLAENHMLQLIRSLELGLKKYNATRALVSGGRGLQQAHFYFFTIGPMVEDQRNYRETLPHLWTKSLFLCRKFKEFMPISWLAENDVEFSRDLLAYWWKANDFLIPTDKRFLCELGSIPHRYDGSSYSEIVTHLFKIVKSHYLVSPKNASKPTPSAPNLH